MSRYLVQVKEVQPDLRFYFIQVGKREYFRPHRTIWLTPKLIRNERGEEFVEFPLKGKIVVTEKGTVKLLSSAEHTTYDVFVGCGFRGESTFEVLDPVVAKIDYVNFHSERGSLGVSRGALVTVDGERPLRVRYTRSGRLYGAHATGIKIFYPDGRVEDFEDVDFAEIEDLKA